MIILVFRRFRRPKDEGLIMHATNIMQKELILQYAYIFIFNEIYFKLSEW